jgi:histidinol-phosphatase
MNDQAKDLALALAMADRADQLTVSYAARISALTVDSKFDGSPVTEADRATEAALIELVGVHRPGDLFLGEESAPRTPQTESRRRWIVDPIDGTLEFLGGGTGWSTQIALEIDGSVEIAVMSFPMLRLRYVATLGGGAHRNGIRISVSKRRSLKSARWSTYLPTDEHLELPPVRRMTRDAGERDEVHNYARLAEGRVDVAFDLSAGVWDFAAARLLVEEAGGRMTDLQEGTRLDTGAMVATNRALHAAALRTLSNDCGEAR